MESLFDTLMLDARFIVCFNQGGGAGGRAGGAASDGGAAGGAGGG